MSVTETKELGQQVQPNVKEGVKTRDPHENNRCRQLENTLDKSNIIAALPCDLQGGVRMESAFLSMRGHLSRPKRGDCELHRDDEFHDHCEKKLQ